MANSLTQHPLVLDSAAATVLITEPFEITKIVWNSGGSGVAGDQLVLKDQKGKVIYDVTIAAAKETVRDNFYEPLEADGLAITTISHGTCYVYHKGATPLKTS